MWQAAISYVLAWEKRQELSEQHEAGIQPLTIFFCRQVIQKA